MNHSQLVYSCKDFSISTVEENEKIIFKEGTSFSIAKPGIYTLEGKNRSGKSVLIRYIMGALVDGVLHDNKATVHIKGFKGPQKIRNVREALRHGLVAVFQDDFLIPTMTIQEQLMLRHYKAPRPKNWFANIFYNIWHFTYSSLLHQIVFVPLIKVYRFFKRLEPKSEMAFPSLEIENRIKNLFRDFNIEEKYLENYPRQLSGGTKDIIKIINALLTPNIKVLFLDEALSHIDGKQKIEIIEKLKSWRERHDEATIVVVSHDEDERLRWQPIDRFFIDEKKQTITSLPYTGYNSLESGIVLKNDFFPVYHSLEKASSFFDKCDMPFIMLIEKKVFEISFMTNYLSSFKYRSEIVVIDINEKKKSLEEFNNNIKLIAARLPKSAGTMIIIGGGVMLNFGAFIAATLHRGLVPHVMIPTTVMAMADVAIGSKASINLEHKPDYSSKKHIVGAYTNPACIILDKCFFESLSSLEKKLGLSECIKHGLLQDRKLYELVKELIEKDKPSDEACFSVCIQTQKLKSSTLMNDPLESDYGRILLYGHLHAHSLERIKNLEISHGLAVYWGIALDLKIAGSSNLYNDFFTLIKSSHDLNAEFLKIIEKIETDKMQFYLDMNAIYNTDTKTQHSKSNNDFEIIPVHALGEYSEIGSEINAIHFDWKTIEKNIRELVADFQTN